MKSTILEIDVDREPSKVKPRSGAAAILKYGGVAEQISHALLDAKTELGLDMFHYVINKLSQ